MKNKVDMTENKAPTAEQVALEGHFKSPASQQQAIPNINDRSLFSNHDENSYLEDTPKVDQIKLAQQGSSENPQMHLMGAKRDSIQLPISSISAATSNGKI